VHFSNTTGARRIQREIENLRSAAGWAVERGRPAAAAVVASALFDQLLLRGEAAELLSWLRDDPDLSRRERVRCQRDVFSGTRVLGAFLGRSTYAAARCRRRLTYGAGMDGLTPTRRVAFWVAAGTLLVVLGAVLSACGQEAAGPASDNSEPPSDQAEPVGAAGLLSLEDLLAEAPLGEWEMEEDTSATEQGVEDSDMPACRDVSGVGASLESGLVEVSESPTLVGEAETDVGVSMSLAARNTVYDYESGEAAQAAYEAIDADLFAECIGRNVTPSERGTVISHVSDGGEPSLGGDGSSVHRVELSDSTYFDGYDNETGSDLIVTKAGSAVLIFQLIVSGQSLDYLGTDPLESEFDTVRAIMEGAS
jgi:hypothetical protein